MVRERAKEELGAVVEGEEDELSSCWETGDIPPADALF